LAKEHQLHSYIKPIVVKWQHDIRFDFDGILCYIQIIPAAEAILAREEQLIMNAQDGKNDTDIAAYNELRDRWDKEDNLLNNRTGAFLTSHAILFAAARFQDMNHVGLCIGIAIVGILLTFFWFLVSKRSSFFISRYGKLTLAVAPQYMKDIYETKRPKLLPPTRIIAVVLPLIVLVCWVSFAIWLIVQI
jgi:hypothetical protein